jgi:hypothetical protein
VVEDVALRLLPEHKVDNAPMVEVVAMLEAAGQVAAMPQQDRRRIGNTR